MPVTRGLSSRGLGGNVSLQVVDADMAASYTSPAITLGKSATIVSFEIYSASATHAGTITIEVSNSGSNWNAVTFDSGSTSITVSNGAALNAFVNLSSLGARYARLVYTRSSGTGTLQFYAWTK